jgi:hypothetical protein
VHPRGRRALRSAGGHEKSDLHVGGRWKVQSEIADTLSISVRTVESHLYSAFAKLGVTNRIELQAALDR